MAVYLIFGMFLAILHCANELVNVEQKITVETLFEALIIMLCWGAILSGVLFFIGLEKWGEVLTDNADFFEQEIISMKDIRS